MVDKDELKSSEYDGIKEYDNDLPRWWVSLFWITIIWGIGYSIWFHLPSTPTPLQRLEAQMAELKEKREKSAPNTSGTNSGEEESQLLALSSDAAVLKKGSELFQVKCAACHGPQGQGLVGPNLTDSFWIHGGKIGEIRNVIVNGVLAKGMLAWGAMMTKEEIDAVTAFVWSIHGTNPPNQKAHEGSEIKR